MYIDLSNTGYIYNLNENNFTKLDHYQWISEIEGRRSLLICQALTYC